MDIETEAKALGWTPQEQFKGSPDKFVGAEEFVQRGKAIMPILRKNNEKLLTEVTEVKGQLGAVQAALREAQESMATFREYHDQTAKRAYDAALRDLRAQKAEAITANDGATVVAVEEAIDKLGKEALLLPKPAAAPPPPPAQQLHPDMVSWERDNAAWLAEPEKQAYAQSVGGYVRAMNPNLTGRAFLDKVTEQVEKFFGGAPSGQRVEGGTTAGARTGSKSYSNLPVEAKTACDRFATRLAGPGKAFKTVEDFRKDYVSKYDWS